MNQHKSQKTTKQGHKRTKGARDEDVNQILLKAISNGKREEKKV